MKGYIGFLDILGYQSFLENNSATDSALKVLDLVTQLPAAVTKKHASFWKEYISKSTESPQFDIEDRVKHLIFSDTIVLLLPISDDESVFQTGEAFLFFSALTSELAATLFEKGLPSRCVIHSGDFLVKDTCFAGRGIVDAYRMCNQLDYAGAILSDSLANEIKSIDPNIFKGNALSMWFINYLSPLKNLTERRYYNINWLAFLAEDVINRCKADVIQFVMDAFWQHEKDCDLNSDAKIRNTCKLLRKCILAHEAYRKNAKEKTKELTDQST